MEEQVVKLYALDKEDLVYLVMGNVPSYDIFDHPLIEGRGRYMDSIGWKWNERALQALPTHELSMIHTLCKQERKRLRGDN